MIAEILAQATQWVVGSATVRHDAQSALLTLSDCTAQGYCDAQLDDYAPPTGLGHRPPLALTLEARFGAEGSRIGTAGFGFWNDPGGTRLRRLRPPQAVWFFYMGAPGRLALDPSHPGTGWFAMTFDAWSPRTALLTLPALATWPLLWAPALRPKLWPLGQAALGARLAAVPGRRDEWRRYDIEWLPERVRLSVDGLTLLDTPFSPRGPLGFVAWIDNQVAQVAPPLTLRGGLVAVPGTSELALRKVTISRPRGG